ncbi:hypothetical protein SteCoe_8892 [Stentor coeruleus]|uniref:Uncharacterized protein n=1 Tax=Stentor coeruleus TaxID=5963 RepID=A0A1R2CJE2_9CILI|nr:hypothetical protein SteCoe_8892 [Stentor coeruleus]
MQLSKQRRPPNNFSSSKTHSRILLESNFNTPPPTSPISLSETPKFQTKDPSSFNDLEKTHKCSKENFALKTIKRPKTNLHLPPRTAITHTSYRTVTTTPEPYEITEKHSKKIRKHTRDQTKTLKHMNYIESESPKSSQSSFYDQIKDLKDQIIDIQEKIVKGEDKIVEKSLEYYELKFIIVKLQNQISKIKKKKIENQLEKAQCKNCITF